MAKKSPKTCKICGVKEGEVKFDPRRSVCNPCRIKEHQERVSADHKVYLRRCLTLAKHRSKKRGYSDFNLTNEQLFVLWEQQRGKCAISGVMMTHHLGGHGQIRDMNASIDRIDSSKGYTIENVQLVTTRVNAIKGDLSHSDLNWWIRSIYDNLMRSQKR